MISHGDQSRNWFWWSNLSLNNPSTTRHSILDRIDCPEKVVIFRATLCGNIACNKLNFCYCTQTGKHLRRIGIAHVRQGHEHPCMLVFDNVSHAFVFFLVKRQNLTHLLRLRVWNRVLQTASWGFAQKRSKTRFIQFLEIRIKQGGNKT